MGVAVTLSLRVAFGLGLSSLPRFPARFVKSSSDELRQC